MLAQNRAVTFLFSPSSFLAIDYVKFRSVRLRNSSVKSSISPRALRSFCTKWL